MKDSEPENAELDDGWDEVEPPRASSAAPPSLDEVQLAAVDDGWGEDEDAPDSSEAEVDSGWDLGDEVAADAPGASDAARGRAVGSDSRKGGNRRGPRRAAPLLADASQRALSKKERRALENRDDPLLLNRDQQRRLERERRRAG